MADRIPSEGGGTIHAASKIRRCSITTGVILKLYVTGKTANSQTAIKNLRQILERDLKGAYELKVIDVLKHPQLAEEDKILATPTLVKRLPPPIRKRPNAR